MHEKFLRILVDFKIKGVFLFLLELKALAQHSARHSTSVASYDASQGS